jgi:pSer/pThr/pTyr-binding forkhead associated (FHA) protein
MFPDRHSPLAQAASWGTLQSLNPKMPNYELTGESATIGRNHGCDVFIDVASISRRHCTLKPCEGDAGAVELFHLSATNGTFLQGKRVASAQGDGGGQVR